MPQSKNVSFSSIIDNPESVSFVEEDGGKTIISRSSFTLKADVDLRNLNFIVHDCTGVFIINPKLNDESLSHFIFDEKTGKLDLTSNFGPINVKYGTNARYHMIRNTKVVHVSFFDKIPRSSKITFSSCDVGDLSEMSENLEVLQLIYCDEVPAGDQMPRSIEGLFLTGPQKHHASIKKPLHLMLLENLKYLEFKTHDEALRIIGKCLENKESIYDAASKLIEAGFEKEALL